MRALKARHRRALVGVAVKGRQPLQRAELLIRAVGAVRRPVVVGLEIQVLVLFLGEGRTQVDDVGTLADLGKNIVKHRVLVHHRRTGGQHFGVDDAGRRCQQEGHLAGVVRSKIADSLHIFVQLLLGGVFHREQLCEHPVVFAQQDAALLSLLEQHLIRRALGVHRRVAEGKLILHPAGKAALPAAVQQGADTEGRELRGLAVFQLQLIALRPQQIHKCAPEQQHRAEEQQRIARAAFAAAFAVYNFRHTALPPFRNSRRARSHSWRPPHSRRTAQSAGQT